MHVFVLRSILTFSAGPDILRVSLQKYTGNQSQTIQVQFSSFYWEFSLQLQTQGIGKVKLFP